MTLIKCCTCTEVTLQQSQLFNNLQINPSDIFLRYFCSKCNEEETLQRLHVSWVDVVHMTLHYLVTYKESENSIEGLKFFHWKSICDEICNYWELLWDREKEGEKWQTSVVAALSTFSGSRFRSGREIKSNLSGYWTLMDNITPSEIEQPGRLPEYKIGPNGELMPLESYLESGKRNKEVIDSNVAEKEARKLKKQMRQLAASYVFSNLDFDRPNPPGSVVISRLPTHTAPQIKFITTDTYLTVMNEGGYCMARTTHGIDRGGKWYFEVEIDSEAGNVRLGIAQILAQTQAPVGFDEFSYGIRDIDGSIIHCGRLKSYGRGFGKGSIIGVLISLPTDDQIKFGDEGLRENIQRDYPPLNFGEYKVKQEILLNGSVSFMVDGVSFGEAFINIYQGKYYPAISLYQGAKVTLNLGPRFKYDPGFGDVHPVCELSTPN